MLNENDELDNLDSNSLSIFHDFLQAYSIGSHDQTKTAIRTIITKTNTFDFSKLTYSDYLVFFGNPDLKTTGNKFSTIKKFFQYLYCHNYMENEDGFEQCFWNKEEDLLYFQNRINLANKPKKNQNQNSEYIPSLTMEQLERLLLFEHECTHSDEISFKNQRLAFCFYLLYFEDLQISTIRNNLDARNFNNGKLITDEKVLDIPEKYWAMLNYYKERPHSGFTQLDEYTRRLGNMVGIKDLVPNNITKKRFQNIFTCPECGKTNLSFSANWKSVNGIIICADCAERITLSSQKKKI